MSRMRGRGRCRGCGEEVDVDVLPDGHTRIGYEETTDWDHEAKCYMNGECSCSGVPVQGRPVPVPVLCGPVDVEPTP